MIRNQVEIEAGDTVRLLCNGQACKVLEVESGGWLVCEVDMGHPSWAARGRTGMLPMSFRNTKVIKVWQ